MEAEASGIYIKVSMDGAPYLRKIDLKVYQGYPELLKALEDMFKFKVGEYLFFFFKICILVLIILQIMIIISI